jgi:hypothetical protein
MQKVSNLFLPNRVTLWGDEATLLAGGAISSAALAGQEYNEYTYNASGANGASGGWNFVIAAGSTYILTVLASKASNRGKMDFYIDNTKVISAYDYYNGTTLNNDIVTAAGLTLAAGRHTASWVANGNTAPSTAYYIAITKAWLKPASDS